MHQNDEAASCQFKALSLLSPDVTEEKSK